MFHTHPDAELPMPPGLLAPGERAWRWIELPLQIPYYVVSFVVNTEDADISLQYMFTHVRDVLNLIDTSGNKIWNLKVGLLSPGHMNGSNSYQFGLIKQIWQSKDGGELFLMDNGSKLYF
jgi:hypothetical protein